MRTKEWRLLPALLRIPLKAFKYDDRMVPRGLKKTLNWTLIIPRDTSLWKISKIFVIKYISSLAVWRHYIPRNFFKILLNQTEIRLYLPCTGWFGSKRMSVWIQINRKMVDTTWFRFDLIRFCENFAVCSWKRARIFRRRTVRRKKKC